MAKEVKAKIKLQCPGGKATPAPPVGPALGQHGVNIGDFVKKFNDATRQHDGLIIPVEITVFTDRTYEFVLKSPPASVLIKKAIGLESGSGDQKVTVGTITRAQLAEIAKVKMSGLNAGSLEAAVRTMAGTARQMGVKVVD